jgi:LysM repeat protein
MKKRSTYLKLGILAIVILGIFVMAVLAGLVVLYLYQQNQVRERTPALNVLITEPFSGTTLPAQSPFVVSVTALGPQKIARVELWMDNQLIDTQVSDQPEGLLPFYAQFSAVVSEGFHLISARAIDTNGMVGNSLPVNIIGGPQKAGEALLAVTVKEGQTLEDIANENQADQNQVQQLNPNLGGGQPPAGGVVIVPAPPDHDVPPPGSQPPAQPGQPAPGGPKVQIPDLPPLGVLGNLPVIPGFIPGLLATMKPAAPTDLTGQVIGCDVLLRWNDHATNESRYDVWTSQGMLAPQVVATLKPSPSTGPAWFIFKAPLTGWVPFWVEAVNASGSQPSNEITLQIDQSCSTPTSNYLQVEVFDMTIQGNYDRVYCYASQEGAPEQRIPEKAGDFIQVSGGKADFSGVAAGAKSKVIPIPADGALDIEGKCLGWSGQTLGDLGPFAGTFVVGDWDGTRRVMKSTSYQIEFAIRPYNAAAFAIAELSMYGYEDPTLPVPYDLAIKDYWSPPRADSLDRTLSWKWDGDNTTITGFVIFLDGIPYKAFSGSNFRQAFVQNPGFCGRHIKWQVAAANGPTHSPLSPALEFDLPACQVFAEVTFYSLDIHCVDNAIAFPVCASGGSFSCDVIDLIDIQFFANKAYLTYLTENFLKAVTCGTWYTFNPYGTETEYKVIVMISETDPSVRIGSRFYYHNKWGEDTMFQGIFKTITMPIDQWKTYQGEFSLSDGCFSSCGVSSTMLYKVRGFEGTYLGP